MSVVPQAVQDARTARLNSVADVSKPHLMFSAGWWYAWNHRDCVRARRVSTACDLLKRLQ